MQDKRHIVFSFSQQPQAVILFQPSSRSSSSSSSTAALTRTSFASHLLHSLIVRTQQRNVLTVSVNRETSAHEFWCEKCFAAAVARCTMAAPAQQTQQPSSSAPKTRLGLSLSERIKVIEARQMGKSMRQVLHFIHLFIFVR